MPTSILQHDQLSPRISISNLGDGYIDLATPESGCNRKVVVVYRGKHCPICTQYLLTLNQLLPECHAIGVDVADQYPVSGSYS